MHKILSHWFTPHLSNNHRAKVLHHSSLLLFIFAFFLGQFIFAYFKISYPAVLGSSIDLSTQRLLELTNNEREKQHIASVKLNPVLAQAAALKADYMFEKNFWAHNGPDGTTPWYFFKKVGYNYTYAGENLARGFTTTPEVMQAWMNSPTHRENILSPNYQETGFAIRKGKLLGEETTLIVEMFGTTDTVPMSSGEEPAFKKLVSASEVEGSSSKILPVTTRAYAYALKTTSLISSRVLSSGIAFFTLGAFIFVLFLDMIIIQRKKIVRVVGHNIDHIFFFSALFLVLFFSLRGLIV